MPTNALLEQLKTDFEAITRATLEGRYEFVNRPTIYTPVLEHLHTAAEMVPGLPEDLHRQHPDEWAELVAIGERIDPDNLGNIDRTTIFDFITGELTTLHNAVKAYTDD